MHELVIKDLSDIRHAAESFVQLMGKQKVFAFYGAMGVGKTTFIREVCDVLQVEDTVTSPSFSIVNEYRTAIGESLFHFDFYRIRRTEEVYDMGYEDYVYSGALCFIEWPELIEELLPEDTIRVKIEEDVHGVRHITF